MKIAYVTSFYPPDRIAGAELGTQVMAEYMLQHGHEVHVIITRPLFLHASQENINGVQIHWLKTWRLPLLRLISQFWCSFWLLVKLRPQLIHANCLLPGGAVAALYGKFYSSKTMILCYGYDVCDMKGLIASLGRWALRNVDQVMAATKFCQRVVMEHMQKPSFSRKKIPIQEPLVFYAGCDENVFHCDPKSSNGPQKRLLFIGRMIPEKGLDFLIQIMSSLPENYILTVIGGGDESKYREMARILNLNDRVVFVGPVSNRELPNYFSQSDAFILPSYREPFGVVCIEAVLSGVPVICSNVMGLPEAVSHNENGFVLDGREINVWSEAIVRACEDQSILARCRKNALTMREKWSWSTRLKELEHIYTELCALVP